MLNDKIKKILKDREIAIKRINTSLEKKIERTNKIFELKNKIEKKIKLTNESKKKKNKEYQFLTNSMMTDKFF